MSGGSSQASLLEVHRSSTVTADEDAYEGAHPCLLAALWVVFHKDGVCGRQVERPAAGLSLA